jgi:serine phosphatase RsbU (regulator of sigma subunit)
VVFRDISERVQLERDKLELYERERHIADVLQNALVPPFTTHRIPGISLALHYQALLNEAEVGGDFYDVFQLDESNYGILIGDVMGKGLSAAIYVAAVRHSIRSYAYVNPSPAKAMTLANDALCREQSDESGMITAFLAVVDTQRRTMTYANGGHEPPLIKSADGGITELGQSGLVLGVQRGFNYIKSTRLLEPGDTVVMITDGITEARRSARGLFGKEGVIGYLTGTKHGSPEGIAAGLMDAAKAHAGGNLQDDAAVLVLVNDE